MGKLFNKYFPAGMFCWFVLSLIIPNVFLSVSESMSVSARMANILLPSGIYILASAWSRNTGRTVLFFIPLMVLCAFQIVLLGLYGSGVIGVDMFLNVATTNGSEVDELLGSLGPSIAFVCFLYLPSIVSSIIMVVRHIKLPDIFRKNALRCGWIAFAFGVMMLAEGYAVKSGIDIKDDIFPVNACYNIKLAAEREMKLKNYHDTSSRFAYGAVSMHDAGTDEIIVAVVGETSRAADWQLCGYGRETNPMLSERKDLFVFDKAFSESNTTHKSVPMLLSPVEATDFDEGIYRVKSIVTAFKEAGFGTTFISNQQPNGSFIEFFASEADTTVYVNNSEKVAPDVDMLPLLGKTISAAKGKQFIVVHTYGSHFNYNDRYEPADRRFTPDDCSSASEEMRDNLLNAYDNTVVSTDRFLNGIIGMLEATGKHASLVYTSDHGEDIFDNGSRRFLHASPAPSLQQVHVPMLAWVSKSYREAYPEAVSSLAANTSKEVSSSRSFAPTALTLGGVQTVYEGTGKSLAKGDYSSVSRMYLDDHNEAVPLESIIR